VGYSTPPDVRIPANGTAIEKAAQEQLEAELVVPLSLNQKVLGILSLGPNATFFYAQYEPSTRNLTYVNGGHNPPLVFRGSHDVLRLEAGGPVVGLLPMFAYEQAMITLQPGDVFVAFTDGISEAMNPANEEWGEERLVACVRTLQKETVPEMIAELIASADQFAAGAKQHDDMTIIVARVLKLPS